MFISLLPTPGRSQGDTLLCTQRRARYPQHLSAATRAYCQFDILLCTLYTAHRLQSTVVSLLRSNKHQAHARVCRVSPRPVTTVQRSGHSPLSAASACTVPASTMTTGTPPAATRAAALSFAATYTREARPESTTERRAELRARSARRPPPPSRRAPPSASAASRPPRQTGRRRSGGGALRRPRRAGGRRCRPRL